MMSRTTKIYFGNLDCIENENINKRCDLNDYVKIN